MASSYDRARRQQVDPNKVELGDALDSIEFREEIGWPPDRGTAMTDRPSPDELAALKDWLRKSGAPAPHRPHTSAEMAQARAEIEAERVDELAEAERIIRNIGALDYPYNHSAPAARKIMAEYARLRLVEQAATALVARLVTPWGDVEDDVEDSETRRRVLALAAAVRGETP